MLVVGDVCGKGPRAAALTSLCRYTLRAAVLDARPAHPAALLDLLNLAILEQTSTETEFASAICVLLRPTDAGADGDARDRRPSAGARQACAAAWSRRYAAPNPIVGVFEDARVRGDHAHARAGRPAWFCIRTA